MADLEDPLGSFFEEINQLPTVSEEFGDAATYGSSIVSSDNNHKSIDKDKETTNDTVVASTITFPPTYQVTAQIISKPAEIISKKPTFNVPTAQPPSSSHPHPQTSIVQSHHTHFQGPSGSILSVSSGNSSSNSSHGIPIDTSKPTSQFAFHNTSTVTVTSVNPKSMDSRPPQPLTAQPGKKFVRKAAGEVWVDESLNEWPENDYRIFVGDLAKEITTSDLEKPFKQYPSFAKAKVVRSKHDNKTKGYGFVSFLDPMDCAKAIREQNGKYLGQRPMKITKSSWKDRDMGEVKKKENKKRKLQESLGLI